MAQPRRINLDEQARVGSCTTAILADLAVTDVKLADDAVTSDKIADGAVSSDKLSPTIAGNGLSFSTGAIHVNVDNSTLEINSDTLRIKRVILENFSSDPTAGTPGRLIWRTDLSEVRIDDGSNFVPLSGSGSGHVIQDEGIALPQRSILDFVGSGVTVTDGGTKTIVSVPQGGHTIEDEGVALPQRSVLNFIGAGVTVTDVGGKTEVSVPGSSGTFTKDLYTVTNPLDHVLPLSGTPITNSELVIWNGLLLRPGASNDYTISGMTVTLAAGITLTIGDELMVVYAQ